MRRTQDPVPTETRRGPGVARLRDPRIWGTTVGAAGGTLFVLANRSALGDPWREMATFVWAGALIAYIWFVFGMHRNFDDGRAPARRAGLIYLGSVAGMLIVIRFGTAVLDQAGATGLRPAIIVIAVGLHFFPFASAFRTPMFNILGTVMVVLGAGGLGLGAITSGTAASAAAVTSGIAMLCVIAADAARRTSVGLTSV
jgi:hypothetical protein